MKCDFCGGNGAGPHLLPCGGAHRRHSCHDGFYCCDSCRARLESPVLTEIEKGQMIANASHRVGMENAR